MTDKPYLQARAAPKRDALRERHQALFDRYQQSMQVAADCAYNQHRALVEMEAQRDALLAALEWLRGQGIAIGRDRDGQAMLMVDAEDVGFVAAARGSKAYLRDILAGLAEALPEYAAALRALAEEPYQQQIADECGGSTP